MNFILAIISVSVVSGGIAVMWPETIPWSGIAVGSVLGAFLLATDKEKR